MKPFALLRSHAFLPVADFWMIATSALAADEKNKDQLLVEDAAQHTANIPVIEESSKAELVREWDPYLCDIGFNFPLSDKPIPIIRSRKRGCHISQFD
jgi:hypothetical protein